MPSISRFGTTASGRPALPLGIIVGTIFSLIISIAAALFHDDNHILFGVVYFICTLMPAIAGAWVLVVKRDSLTGVIRNPDNSVEQQWYANAATTAFHAVLFCGALGFIAALFVDGRIAGILMVPVFIAMVTFAISYMHNKHSAS
ncbi:MAG: hypothetical protein SOW59_09160 [Corynebacterium sp.]|nr:hypothetical protein [Corynebacterium sp.]